jgi:hypothetical protein
VSEPARPLIPLHVPDPSLPVVAPALVYVHADGVPVHGIGALVDRQRDVHDEEEEKDGHHAESQAELKKKKDAKAKKVERQRVEKAETEEITGFKKMLRTQIGSMTYDPAQLGSLLESKEANAIMGRWQNLIDAHSAGQGVCIHIYFPDF